MKEKTQVTSKKKWQKPCVHSLDVPDLTQTGDHFDRDEDSLDPSIKAFYHPSA